MQHQFSVFPRTLTQIQHTLSAPRLDRYLPATGGNHQFALRVYLWNARLCREFYFPTQLAEVAMRNSIARGLNLNYGANWYNAPAFKQGLPDHQQFVLSKAVRKERHRHGPNITANHVVSALPFGFWVHFLTARPTKVVWRNNLQAVFPHLPTDKSRRDVHAQSDQLRRFRNRIAHHDAIFDQRPTVEYANILEIVSWICPDTHWLIKQSANPARVISQRPQS